MYQCHTLNMAPSLGPVVYTRILHHSTQMAILLFLVAKENRYRILKLCLERPLLANTASYGGKKKILEKDIAEFMVLLEVSSECFKITENNLVDEYIDCC